MVTQIEFANSVSAVATNAAPRNNGPANISHNQQHSRGRGHPPEAKTKARIAQCKR